MSPPDGKTPHTRLLETFETEGSTPHWRDIAESYIRGQCEIAKRDIRKKVADFLAFCQNEAKA